MTIMNKGELEHEVSRLEKIIKSKENSNYQWQEEAWHQIHLCQHSLVALYREDKVSESEYFDFSIRISKCMERYVDSLHGNCGCPRR